MLVGLLEQPGEELDHVAVRPCLRDGDHEIGIIHGWRDLDQPRAGLVVDGTVGRHRSPTTQRPGPVGALAHDGGEELVIVTAQEQSQVRFAKQVVVI